MMIEGSAEKGVVIGKGPRVLSKKYDGNCLDGRREIICV